MLQGGEEDQFLNRLHTCNKTKSASQKCGYILNSYLGVKSFCVKTEYRVCSNMRDKMNSFIAPVRNYTERAVVSKKHHTRCNPVLPVPLDVSTLCNVHIRVPESLTLFPSIPMQELDICEDNLVNLTRKPTQKKRKLEYVNRLLQLSGSNKKPYRVLKERPRENKIRSIADQIIALCIDKTELRQDGYEYLLNNDDLGIDICMVTDECLDYIGVRLRRKLSDLSNIPTCPPPEDITPEQDNITPEPRTFESAIALLSVTSKSRYKALRVPLAKDCNMKKKDFPSYHMLTKDRSPVEGTILQPSFDLINEPSVSEIHEDDFEEQLKVIEAKYKKDIETNPEADLQVLQRDIICAKFKGTFEDHCTKCIDKFEKKGIELKEDLVIIDSYDGAEHVRNSSGRSNVISYNSQVISKDIIDAGYSPAGSFGILTWCQTLCEETFENIIPVCRSIFREKRELIEKGEIKGRKIFCYELHDGKMIYSLTKHAALNSKHSPFLLCKCKRGAGVKNPNHECKLISEQDQKKYYEKSERRTLAKSHDAAYDFQAHKQWCDKHNFGITHYGFHPDVLSRDTVRFDGFHMRSAVTRKLQNYLRSVINKQSHELIQDFSQVLLTFWGTYHVSVWRLNKQFTSFTGNEFKLFIANIPKIVAFLRERLDKHDSLDNLCNALSLWPRILTFVNKVSYENDVAFEDAYAVFLCDVKAFYSCGSNTFLTKDDTGDLENFYCHVLRFYMPQHARTTWERHKLGLGIFTMQGFERRNKESKNCFRRFTNKKGNFLVSTLRRLWDSFIYEKVAV